ncbi:MAG: PQQ-like beta-propeller repeat protein [Phycisphaeraceae bacterium]|nr:PQQ-like beta-propeller repeat protein [Phycisphaeraceae bacterium]
MKYCRLIHLPALLLLLVLPAGAADWPGFQGPNRSGVAPETNILTDWPDEGPAVLWSNDVGPGFGGAAIKDGRVYILDRNDIKGDRLGVYELSTGKAVWACDYDAPGRISYHGSRSTPMVTDSHAFTVGAFGQVTCFDLSTRKVAWQKHMDDFGAAPPKWAWSQSPLIVGDTVVIAPMAGDAGLVALKPATGEVVWKSPGIGREGYGSPRLMTLAGKEQIVTLTSTLVTGVDPETGKILWSYDGIPVKRGIPTPTDIGSNRVFITAGYNAGSALIEIQKQGDTFTAKEIHRDNEQGGQIHSTLLVDGHLYVNLNTNENLRRAPTPGLGCFDLTGKLLWTNDTPKLDRGAVLAVGKHLLTLGGEDGTLRLAKADPKGYRELASTKVFDADQKRNMIWAPMSFADGRLIVRSQNQLKCLDLRPNKSVQ